MLSLYSAVPRHLSCRSSLRVRCPNRSTIRPSRTLCSTTSLLHRQESSTDDITAVSSSTYTAPLKKTVRNIKLFSLSSLALSTLIAPVFFLIESDMEMGVRAVMIGIALSTSALSTGAVQWVLKPYCVAGHAVQDASHESTYVLQRLTWLGQTRSTTVRSGDLKIEKNGRMFSNLVTLDGKDQFYVHETTRFWSKLTQGAQVSQSAEQV